MRYEGEWKVAHFLNLLHKAMQQYTAEQKKNKVNVLLLRIDKYVTSIFREHTLE